jgi:hypothetical protein
MELQINTLALEDGLYAQLDKAVARAVLEADQEPPKRKPSKRSGGIPQEQLDMMLENGDMAYLNEDWAETVKTYMELLESGADLPSFIDARLALSYACLNEWEPAFEHATKSYENTPVEGAAYLAMAKCCNLVISLPEAGLRWLSLASKALHAPLRILKETKFELEEALIANEQEERYAVPFLQQEDAFEKISANPEFTCLVDLDELQMALTTVQQDMSRLKETRGRSIGLTALLKILWSDPDVLLPRSFSHDETLEMLQKSCPLHHLGDLLFRKIAAHLPLNDIASLQATCKLNHHWGNHPDLWKAIYCRYWEPLQDSVFGVPLLPYMWKYNFKTRHGILSASNAVFDTIKHQRADLSDIEAMRKRALTHLAKKYRLSTSPATAGTMANQFIETIDLLATSTTPINSMILFENPAFLTVAVTSLTRYGLGGNVLECQSAILALICGALAGGPQVMKSLLLLGVKTICSNLMFGSLHTEATALTAVLRLGETNFAKPTRAIMPSMFWCQNFSDERISSVIEALDGVWKHFMFYDNLDLKGVIELGACDMKFDANSGLISGSGSDTIGAFRLNEASNFNLRTGEVTLIREYHNGPIMEFVGVSHPYGFGGYFQMASTMEDENGEGGQEQQGLNEEEGSGGTPLLGYWTSHFAFQSMSEEEWKVFKADMKSKATKRKMGKHAEAWQEDPSHIAIMFQDLRQLTRSTFLISLPTATYSDIYSQLESLPQISEEDLKKYPSPPLLKGPGETEEKFRLRETTHAMMMMLLFERRAQLGLAKWMEVENDLHALESHDPSSPAIIHKWHDYLCLYTFDNYAISNGVESLCHFFRAVLSMAQEIRSSGGDPSGIFSSDPNTSSSAHGMSSSAPNASASSSSSSTSRPAAAAAAAAASSSSFASSSSTSKPSSSSLDNDLDRLPDHIPVDSDVESIHTEEEGVDVFPLLHNASLRSPPSSSSSTSNTQNIHDDSDSSDSDSEDSDDAMEPSTTSQQRYKKVSKKRTSSSSVTAVTTLVVAAGFVAAVSAGVYALTRYLTRPKANKQ